MTVRERFLSVLNFKKPEGGIPATEWAPYWDRTLNRWEGEGLKISDYETLCTGFGLDIIQCIAVPVSKGLPAPKNHGAGVIKDEKDYERLRPCLLPENAPDELIKAARNLKSRHDSGDIIVRLWLDGFLVSEKSPGYKIIVFFYDQPDLLRHERGAFRSSCQSLQSFTEFTPNGGLAEICPIQRSVASEAFFN